MHIDNQHLLSTLNGIDSNMGLITSYHTRYLISTILSFGIPGSLLPYHGHLPFTFQIRPIGGVHEWLH
jgi:hypothetical protein